jgi:glutamate synthase domain-containing protein 3
LVAPVTIEADGIETRQVNNAIREAIAGGATEIRVDHPAGRHSFAVGLKAAGVRIDLDGPAGWYTAGMNVGPHVVVHGNTGWGVGECMMDGRRSLDCTSGWG